MEDIHHIGNYSVLTAHFFLLFNILALTERKKSQANELPTTETLTIQWIVLWFYSEGWLWEEDY